MRKPRDEVRQHIISAAIKVFATFGYFRAPISIIAREAGVSKGLIFWYFQSKDELIVEVARRSLPIDIIEECLEADLTGVEMLKCLGKRYIEKYSDPVYRNLLLHTMSAENIYPSVGEELRRICGEYMYKIAEKVFGEKNRNNIVKLRMFFGSLLCYALMKPENITGDEYLDQVLKIIYSQSKNTGSG